MSAPALARDLAWCEQMQRWARDEYFAGNKMGVMGMTDALTEEVLIRAEVEEAERQLRIAQGIEHACAACGCSESRACDGGCVWATETLCSTCVR